MKGKSKKNKGKKIAEEAQNKIDSPTKTGGMGPFEFDSAGLSYYCCSQAGIKIPEDMSIIGSDGVNVSTLSRPEITTLKIDFETYGNKVFEAMEALINGQTYNELTLIRPELVIRGSSR